MKICKIDLYVIVTFIIRSFVVCPDYDNRNAKVEDKKEKHGINYFIRSIIETKHNEDELTETSHNHKWDSEQIRRYIERLFTKMDNNHDRKIERGELLSYLVLSMKDLHNESTNEEFKKVDINKNEKVSLDEYFIFKYEGPSEITHYSSGNNLTTILNLKKERDRFKAADNDADGYLNHQEYLSFKYPIFFPQMAHTVVHDYIYDLDLNNDGMVNKKEYVNHFHIEDSTNEAYNEKSLNKVEEDFVTYDKDRNGRIDSEEYHEVLKPGYDEPARSEADYLLNENDSNRDGVLTLHEIDRHSHSWLGLLVHFDSRRLDDEL